MEKEMEEVEDINEQKIYIKQEFESGDANIISACNVETGTESKNLEQNKQKQCVKEELVYEYDENIKLEPGVLNEIDFEEVIIKEEDTQDNVKIPNVPDNNSKHLIQHCFESSGANNTIKGDGGEIKGMLYFSCYLHTYFAIIVFNTLNCPGLLSTQMT